MHEEQRFYGERMSNKTKDELAFIKVVRRFVKQNIWYLTAKDYQRGVVYEIRISEQKMKEGEI